MPTIVDLKKSTNETTMTNIDMKDALFHIPVKPYFDSFLWIKYHKQYILFAILPFGLAASPAISDE